MHHSNYTRADGPVWRLLVHSGSDRGYWSEFLSGSKAAVVLEYESLLKKWDLEKGSLMILNPDGKRERQAGNNALLGRETQ